MFKRAFGVSMTVKVLVVDDSGFFRRRLTEILSSDGQIQVVGTASNGQEAIEQTLALRPDVITMDYEMPVMDGITAVKHIMQRSPTPVLMFSSLTQEGARVTLDALDAGALDYLPKNFEDISRNPQKVRQLLCDKVHILAKSNRRALARPSMLAGATAATRATASLSTAASPARVRQAVPTPTPTPTPTKSNINLSKIKLDKNNSTINLSKKGSAFGKISVNLNWNKSAPKSESFFQKLTRSNSIDLDLGAMVQLKDGSIDLVQPLGNRFGNFDRAPYMKLDADDRTGASLNGENLHINGTQWDRIERIVIYTYIYEGAAQWAATDGVVTIRIPDQPEIEVRLTEGNQLTTCAIIELKNVNGAIQANREVRYFKDQQFLDKFYRFGFRWTQGSKD